MTIVGFVGLGAMGQRMARQLVASGFDLVVHDIDATTQADFAIAAGTKTADTATDFGECDAVITMLPTGVEVREALLEWDGGIATALRPGTVLLEMSSSNPVGTRELGSMLSERGLTLIDAPVSGGTGRAENGTLAIMIGTDDQEAVRRTEPILRALGSSLSQVGPLGSGHAVKALNNYVSAAAFTATADALLIGARFGVEPADVLEVLNAGDARSVMTERVFGPDVLERRFDDGFRLALMAKDIRIAEELRAAVGITAPICELTNQLWQEALVNSEAAADYTAAFKHWEQLNGLELKEHSASTDG